MSSKLSAYLFYYNNKHTVFQVKLVPWYGEVELKRNNTVLKKKCCLKNFTPRIKQMPQLNTSFIKSISDGLFCYA